MWKKYLCIPAVLSALAMPILLVLGFEADTQLGLLPQLLPISICSSLPLYIVLAIILLFSSAKVDVEDNVKWQRILMGICLLVSVGGFAIASWGSSAYTNIPLIMLAALNMLTAVSTWPVPVVTIALLVSSVMLASRLWKTRPEKKPWEY